MLAKKSPPAPLEALSQTELLALPAAINLETAGRALGMRRSTAYSLARRGEFPVRTLRLGKQYRVVTAELLDLLGVAPSESVSQQTVTTGGDVA